MNEVGITYQEDCLIGVKNFIERFLCNFNAQQQQYIKIVFVIVVTVLVLTLFYFISKRVKEKRIR